MQHLHRMTQNKLTNESGLLFAGIGAHGINQGGFTVAQAELYNVLADKGGVAIHGVSFVLAGGDVAKNGPIHIGSELFAWDFEKRLNVWASFSGNPSQAPLVDNAVTCQVHRLCHSGYATGNINRLIQRGNLGRFVHGSYFS
jgi:hypothetical protein